MLHWITLLNSVCIFIYEYGNLIWHSVQCYCHWYHSTITIDLCQGNHFIFFTCHLSTSLIHFGLHLLFFRPHGWPGAAATFSSGFEPGSRSSGQPPVPRAGLWWREGPAQSIWLQGPVEESHPPTDFAHPHGEREPAPGGLVFLPLSYNWTFINSCPLWVSIKHERKCIVDLDCILYK